MLRQRFLFVYLPTEHLKQPTLCCIVDIGVIAVSTFVVIEICIVPKDSMFVVIVPEITICSSDVLCMFLSFCCCCSLWYLNLCCDSVSFLCVCVCLCWFYFLFDIVRWWFRAEDNKVQKFTLTSCPCVGLYNHFCQCCCSCSSSSSCSCNRLCRQQQWCCVLFHLQSTMAHFNILDSVCFLYFLLFCLPSIARSRHPSIHPCIHSSFYYSFIRVVVVLCSLH